jgi:hypothetical protein
MYATIMACRRATTLAANLSCFSLHSACFVLQTLPHLPQGRALRRLDARPDRPYTLGRRLWERTDSR